MDEHVADLANQFDGKFTDATDLGGKIAAAHLLGVGGSKNLGSTDANNTSGREYYDLGANAVASGTSISAQEKVAAEAMTDYKNRYYENQGVGEKTINALKAIPAGVLDAAKIVFNDNIINKKNSLIIIYLIF